MASESQIVATRAGYAVGTAKHDTGAQVACAGYAVTSIACACEAVVAAARGCGCSSCSRTQARFCSRRGHTRV